MKLLIASDIHGSAYWCRALMAQIEVESPDTVVLLGDLLYHGPRNDLPRDYAPKEVLAMLNTLAKIMDKFDIEEIKENPGLFGKLFGNLRKQLDKILAKYHTMGDEVDKIYVQLKQYEADIKQSNRKLEEMFQANVNY